METIWNKIKSNILYTAIMSFIIFMIVHFFLKLFHIQFRTWVYYCVALLTMLGILLGIVQILITKSKKVKIIVFITSIIIVIAITMVQIFLKPSMGLILVFLYRPEHIVWKDGNRYVAHVSSFFEVHVSYYDYMGPFLMGNTKKIYENYGKGGYDPFDGKHDKTKPIQSYYYDDNKEELIEQEIAQDTTSKSKKTLYKKKINDEIAIRVVVNDYILSGRTVIGIEKTMDGGNTWKEQGEETISDGTKFVFIDENIGFINDSGRVGKEALLVTTDGGKTFVAATINFEQIEKKIHIEDIPYEEDDMLKLKAYIIENSNKKYYYFYSDDNGKEWKPL